MSSLRSILRRRSGVLFFALISCTALSLAATASHASVLGQVYMNQPETGNSGLISSIPGTSSDASFFTSDINYSSSSGYTIGSFLNNPGFFNTSATFNPNAALNDTLLVFTGQTYLNAGANSFVTPHDDGFEFSIPDVGFDFQYPGPTPPVFSPYIVNAPADGLYDFEISYFEGWGPPAVIGVQINGAPINNPVPEPSTVILLGAGLAGLALARRRSKA